MTHVALVNYRSLNRVGALTTDPAPRAIYINKRRVYRQALDSKLVCEPRRIDFNSADRGLCIWKERVPEAGPLREFTESHQGPSQLIRRSFGRRWVGVCQTLTRVSTVAALRVVFRMLEGWR